MQCRADTQVLLQALSYSSAASFDHHDPPFPLPPTNPRPPAPPHPLLPAQIQVLLATGPAVDTLVSSGVSSYLEFKDMQGLYLGSDVGPGAGGGQKDWGVRNTVANGKVSDTVKSHLG